MTHIIESDMVLISVGRKANTDGLGLNDASFILLANGAIEVDDNYQTSNKNIFAVGDCSAKQ